MNTYAVIILITLLGEFFLNLIADLLNMRTLSGPLPGEFAGVFDAEAYRKAQRYAETRLEFGLLTSTISLSVTLVFWFAGGFRALDDFVRQWHPGVIWTGMLYIGILLLARSVLSLPFSIYSIFVIEERFGFNTTTGKTFGADIAKGLALAIVIGGPLLLGILWLFEFAGSIAWFYGWIVGTIVALFIQFIAPTWIMPLFNKFTPLPDGELKEKIVSFAGSVDFSLKEIAVMDGSKRSSKSNAFFTGFGKNKRIALFDTLIAQHTVPELVAVLAHEIGHYKKKHIVQSMVIGILHTGVMLYLLSLFVGNERLSDAFSMEHPSVYAGMIFFGMLFTPLEFLLSLLLHARSRRNEFAADRFAAETTKDPKSMIDALKKLSVHNLSHLTPHPFYVALNYSHPPVLERIRALEELEV